MTEGAQISNPLAAKSDLSCFIHQLLYYQCVASFTFIIILLEEITLEPILVFWKSSLPMLMLSLVFSYVKGDIKEKQSIWHIF